MVYRRHLTPVGDPWAGTTGEQYDPNEFYVRSMDKSKANGEGVTVHVKFPADLIAEASRLIASGSLAGTPIQTLQDAMRDAFVHWMHKVAPLVNDPMFTRAAETQRRLARIDGIGRDYEANQRVLNGADELFSSLQTGHEMRAIDEALHLYDQIVEDMHEPFSSQLREKLTRARRWVAQEGRK